MLRFENRGKLQELGVDIDKISLECSDYGSSPVSWLYHHTDRQLEPALDIKIKGTTD